MHVMNPQKKKSSVTVANAPAFDPLGVEDVAAGRVSMAPAMEVT